MNMHGNPSDRQVLALAETFRLLGDATRLRILLACAAGPVAVGDIAHGLGLSPSLVSHHLRLLRAGRLVASDRQGRRIFYRLADAHVGAMLAGMTDHVAEADA